MVIAVLGLVVNFVCATILGKAHHHDGHSHGHEHGGHVQDGAHGHDLNLKSAYLHVLADAATSVLAIMALAGGWLYGWSWLDPVMGIVGAIVVALWARSLIAQTSKVLLDARWTTRSSTRFARSSKSAPGRAIRAWSTFTSGASARAAIRAP